MTSDKKKKKKIEIRAKKEFTYRGYTLDELKKMTLDEFMMIAPSRIRRTIRRGLAPEHIKLLKHLRKGKDRVKTHARDMPIIPEMVGKVIVIHAGKDWKDVYIQPEMLGHYLGEFAMTRKEVKHSGPGVGATRSSKFLPLK
jgi:small subunit ribosomal protein S19